jgi:hypothetical protein
MISMKIGKFPTKLTLTNFVIIIFNLLENTYMFNQIIRSHHQNEPHTTFEPQKIDDENHQP